MITDGIRSAPPPSEAAEVFLRVIVDAAAALHPEYVEHPYVARGLRADRRARERIYCYELYHQVRLLMEKSNDPATKAALAHGYVLNAEVDKRLSYLPTRTIPDLLWHVPGAKDNAVVVEVKRAGVTLKTLQKDIAKLEEFVAATGYSASLLVVFGRELSDVTRWMLERTAARKGVALLLHPAQGAPVLVRAPSDEDSLQECFLPRQSIGGEQ